MSSEENTQSIETGDGNIQQLLPTGITTAQLMNNPQLLAAVQAELNGLVGSHSGYIESLPKCVKRRINALKNIQVEFAKIEGKFYEEAHQLEMKYAELYKPLYEKRSHIVNALHEPTDEEAAWTEPGEDEEDKNEDDEEEKKTDGEEKTEKTDEELANLIGGVKMDENTKGIPEFWSTAMKNVDVLTEMIQEHDEPVLKHLTDINLIFTGKTDTDDADMGFVLEFQFSENEHFTNTALTKTYKMKSEPDVDDPFSFEGPDIVTCTGCKIDWKDGKNITQKQVKKKQKHKGRGQTRVVTKTVQTDSFFNFFDPPEVPEDEDDMDEETEALLAADFEIGHYFRERFIPKAVLYFTGEAVDEESDSEDEMDEDEDDDDDDDDEENDPDFNPPADGEKPENCKQQ